MPDGRRKGGIDLNSVPAPAWAHDPIALGGRRVVVMGLGVQSGGLGVAAFMRDHGADLVVTDLRSEAQLAPSLAALGGAGVRYVLGRTRSG